MQLGSRAAFHPALSSPQKHLEMQKFTLKICLVLRVTWPVTIGRDFKCMPAVAIVCMCILQVVKNRLTDFG
jgi:hypothetical protein